MPRREDSYEAVFNALAHPAGEVDGQQDAGEIASMFEHAWQTTTRHLQVLEAAGLLRHERRGRQWIYYLERKRLELVADWLATFKKKEK